LKNRSHPAEVYARLGDWPSDEHTAKTIRQAVFVEEQGVPAELEWDGDDSSAISILAFSPEGQAIGTARLLPSGQIGRMAVLADWRNRGAGSLMLGYLLHLVPPRARSSLWLNAQRDALGFYRRHGFEAVGAEFLEAGIPHQRMACGTDKT